MKATLSSLLCSDEGDNVPLNNLMEPLSESRQLLSVAKGYRLNLCVN